MMSGGWLRQSCRSRTNLGISTSKMYEFLRPRRLYEYRDATPSGVGRPDGRRLMTDRTEARLVYDTKTQPWSAGVRTAGQRARRFLYAADEAELVIQVAPDRQPDHCKLSGQVLDEGMPIEGAAVSLHGVTTSVHRETD